MSGSTRLEEGEWRLPCPRSFCSTSKTAKYDCPLPKSQYLLLTHANLAQAANSS